MVMSGALIVILLLRSGDVELNPGPMTEEDLKQVDDTQVLGERDFHHLYSELVTLKANYYQLGIGLGLPPGELLALRKGAQDIEQAFSEVLLAWLKNVGNFGPPTWRRLVKAVDSPAGGNNPALAMAIAEKHCIATGTNTGPVNHPDNHPPSQSPMLQPVRPMMSAPPSGATSSYMLWPPFSHPYFPRQEGHQYAYHQVQPQPHFAPGTPNFWRRIENKEHYEAYLKALQDGLNLTLSYMKFLFFGPPRSGKTTTRRRLLREFVNLSQLNKPTLSTGVAETNDVIIKKFTNEPAAIASSQWWSMKRNKERTQPDTYMHREEDLGYLAQLFYQLINTYKTATSSTSNESVPVQARSNPLELSTSSMGTQDEAKLGKKLTESEEVEIKNAFEKLTSILKSDSPEELKQLLKDLIMINMMDVGGQPAFLDMLPALTTGPALYLLFFRLDQELKTYYPVRYLPADSKDELTLESSYSTEEVLFQSLASIACFSCHSLSSKPQASSGAESATKRQVLRSAESAAKRQVLRSAGSSNEPQASRSAESAAKRRVLRSAESAAKRRVLRSTESAAKRQVLRSAGSSNVPQASRSAESAAKRRVLRSAESATKRRVLRSAESAAKRRVLSAESAAKRQVLRSAGSSNEPQASRSAESAAKRRVLRSAESAAKRRVLRSAESAAKRQVLRSAGSSNEPQASRSAESAAKRRVLRSVESAAKRGVLRSVESAAKRGVLRSAGSTNKQQTSRSAESAAKRGVLRSAGSSNKQQASRTAESVTKGRASRSAESASKGQASKGQASKSTGSVSKPQASSSDESASKSQSSSRALLFGTYKDKVGDNQISKMESTLQDKFTETKLYKEGLLMKSSKGKMMFTVDNMFGTDESEMSGIRKDIEEIIKTNFPAVPIPAAWLMFRIVLNLLNKPVVSVTQCEEIAKKLSMHTPVQEALWFFHHNIGSLMHYPNIPSMKDTVICDPQVIYDCISSLIIDKFKYNNRALKSCQVDEFLQKGQFTLSHIADKTSDLQGSHLTLDQLMDLLKHHNVVAEIIHDQENFNSSQLERDREELNSSQSEPKFIMPAILKVASDEELNTAVTTSPSDQPIAPIVIYFEGGFVPFGVFCTSVAHLIAHQDSMSPKWQLCNDQVKRNKITFCIDSAFYVNITSRPQYLKIFVSRHSGARSKRSLPEICSTIRQTVVETLKTVISKMRYKPYAMIETPLFSSIEQPFDLAFTCCLDYSHGDHLMKVVEDEDEWYAKCLEKKIDMDLKGEHHIWFGQDLTSKSESQSKASTSLDMDSGNSAATATPDLLTIEDLNTVQNATWEVRSKWYNVGLGLGILSNTLDAIRESNQGVCEKCYTEMLKQWLESNNPRRTWSALANALRSPSVGHGDLADQLPPK